MLRLVETRPAGVTAVKADAEAARRARDARESFMVDDNFSMYGWRTILHGKEKRAVSVMVTSPIFSVRG
jgi:hypothetical protein